MAWHLSSFCIMADSIVASLCICTGAVSVCFTVFHSPCTGPLRRRGLLSQNLLIWGESQRKRQKMAATVRLGLREQRLGHSHQLMKLRAHLHPSCHHYRSSEEVGDELVPFQLPKMAVYCAQASSVAMGGVLVWHKHMYLYGFVEGWLC